ncbi:nuclear transport factor 2 family protein [Mycolicibacterium fortuitum]|nr:nuclear transport factor 2 family protein [Mycolicibacterium fortuitum]
MLPDDLVNDPAAVAEVLAQYPRMKEAIVNRDHAALVDLHDAEFLGTELPGHLITAEEHIQTTMNSRDLEMEYFDLQVKTFGDIALCWGKQSLKGTLDGTDPGTSPAVAAKVSDGVFWSMLVVWRRTNGRWRLLSYQVTPLSEVPPASGPR